MNLTREQQLFFKQHHIPEHAIFDATGIATKEYKRIMKNSQYMVAIGVAPCQMFGHSVRTASGHCLMCDPKKIRFQQRHRETAFVYIAQPSSNKSIIKIGLTTNVRAREQSLNSPPYGGFNHWKIIKFEQSENAGKLESLVHHKLKDFGYQSSYRKDQKSQSTYELFKCTRQHAATALATAVEEIDYPNVQTRNNVATPRASKKCITAPAKINIATATVEPIKPTSAIVPNIKSVNVSDKPKQAEVFTRDTTPALRKSQSDDKKQENKPLSFLAIVLVILILSGLGTALSTVSKVSKISKINGGTSTTVKQDP